MSRIQALVDALGERIGQPMGVDDRRYRAIAYSSHPDEIDTVRRVSILGRQAPDGVTEWLDRLDVARATGHVRVPANAELGMVARVCFPLRFDGRLFGFLWLTDEHGTLSGEEIDVAARATSELAQELIRLDQLEREERGGEAEAVRCLTEPGSEWDSDREVRAAAAARYAVAVVTAAASAASDAQTEVRLIAAAERVRRSSAPGHVLARVARARAVVILAGASVAEVEELAAVLLRHSRVEMSDLDGAVVHVGVGAPCRSLDGLPRARREAELALQLACMASDLGPLLLWSRLGAYRLVAELLDERDPAAFVPAAVWALLADPDGEALVRTAEAYLEHGGAAAPAAAQLFIHRSSLYHRLHRIEGVAGVDMRSGSDRLELQLGLRLWRLAGAPTTVEPLPTQTRRRSHPSA